MTPISTERKQELLRDALREGIINGPHWANRLDEPMPVWAILEMMLDLKRKLDPPSWTYD